MYSSISKVLLSCKTLLSSGALQIRNCGGPLRGSRRGERGRIWTTHYRSLQMRDGNVCQRMPTPMCLCGCCVSPQVWDRYGMHHRAVCADWPLREGLSARASQAGRGSEWVWLLRDGWGPTHGRRAVSYQLWSVKSPPLLARCCSGLRSAWL